MNSRERVIKAIDFKGPDRIPTCYYSSPFKGDVMSLVTFPPEGWMPPEPHFPYGVIPQLLTLGLWKPRRRLPRGWHKTKHTAMDEWGCLWDVDGSKTFLGQIKKGALEDSWDLLESYQPPDMRIKDRYILFGLYKQISGVNRYRLAHGGNLYFERFHFLRGFQNAMMDFGLYPDKVERLLDKMEEHYLGFIETVGKMGVDGVQFTDDLGTQQDLIISPRMWQKYFKPRYAKLINRAHELGMHFILHSCGNIKRLLPDFLEVGIDALQLDAPDQTGLDTLAEEVGGKMAFFNVVDIQKVLPHGSPEEIINYVKEMVIKLGSYNGGLVAATYPTLYSIGATSEQEKIMFDSYKIYGAKQHVATNI